MNNKTNVILNIDTEMPYFIFLASIPVTALSHFISDYERITMVDCKMESNGGGSVTEIGGLNIMTWNINGLRSFQNFPEIVRKDFIITYHRLVSRTALSSWNFCFTFNM